MGKGRGERGEGRGDWLTIFKKRGGGGGVDR